MLAYITQNRESLIKFDRFKQLLNPGGELLVEMFVEMEKMMTSSL